MSNSQAAFYVHMPSDSCMEEHPENTAASWTTRLKRTINLPGQWEMAVVELIYPNAMFNVPVDQKIACRQIVSIAADGVLTPEVDFITVTAGMYNRAELIESIQSQAPKLKPLNGVPAAGYAFSMKSHVTEARVRLKINSLRVSLEFDPASQHFLHMLLIRIEIYS